MELGGGVHKCRTERRPGGRGMGNSRRGGSFGRWRGSGVVAGACAAARVTALFGRTRGMPLEVYGESSGLWSRLSYASLLSPF